MGELIWMRLLWTNKIILFDYVCEKLWLHIQLCTSPGLVPCLRVVGGKWNMWIPLEIQWDGGGGGGVKREGRIEALSTPAIVIHHQRYRWPPSLIAQTIDRISFYWTFILYKYSGSGQETIRGSRNVKESIKSIQIISRIRNWYNCWMKHHSPEERSLDHLPSPKPPE